MTQTAPLAGIPQTAPVFPLPGVVFFPRTVLPLHIFEPRYRTMIADAEKGDRCIAVSLLRAGWEKEYDGAPAFHDVGCVGAMTDVTRTGDGRYYLKLVGLRKVILGDLVGVEPYRTACIQPVEESVPGDFDPESRGDLARLLGACAVLVQELSEKAFPMVTVKEGLPYETVVNSVCAHVGLPPEIKQSLLETNDLRNRCVRLTDFLEEHLQRLLLSRGPEAGEHGTVTVN